MEKVLKAFIILFAFTSCMDQQKVNVKQLTQGYYESYAHKDLATWISYYDQNSIIYDVTTGVTMKSKDSILNLVTPVFNGEIPFYANIQWEIDDIIADGFKVSVKGRISNAFYNGMVLPKWDFISQIIFNDQGKIKEQYDFVDYPDLSSGSGPKDLTEQLLTTWNIHCNKNLELLRAIDDSHLSDKYNLGEWTISQQVVHMVKVRNMWLEVIAPGEEIRVNPIHESKAYNRTEIVEHLKSSGELISKLLQTSLADTKSYDWPSNESNFMGYLISHESHHRGQIVLSLKQSGHSLPDEVTYGLWNWEE